MPGVNHPPMRFCPRCDRTLASNLFTDIRDMQGVVFSGCAPCLRSLLAGNAPAPARPLSDVALAHLLERAVVALTTPQGYQSIGGLVVELQEAQALLSPHMKG